MNNSKAELIDELIILDINTKLFPNKLIPFENLKIINEQYEEIINTTCINCARYDKILYNQNYYHCCYDNWSKQRQQLGWHVIYPETLMMCSERREQ
jgi:hypothetical protein